MLPMAKILCVAMNLVTLASLCAIGRAQVPETDPMVSIVPRVRPALHGAIDDVPGPHLRIDSSLVLVPVHATSSAGTSITDLTAANFRVFEDGEQQKVASFSKEDAPLSVGLVFDASGSMSNKIRKSAEAAAAFFKTSNMHDEFFLVEFGEKPRLSMPFTPDSNQIYQKISHARPFGRTSLIDAIHLALLEMKNARNSRKAIVILSDGGDNRSRFTRGEVKGALIESDVQLFAMGIFDNDDLAKHTQEERGGPRLLDELAENTGGRAYPVDNLNDLASISTAIGDALRTEYLIGYTPTNPSRDGKYRHITVKVDPPQAPPANVTYRRGYYAPAQ